MGSKPKWVTSFKSHIFVFNVGRGLSIFIRTPLNQGIIYDFGCSEDFKPSEFLKTHILPHLDPYKGQPLAQRFISHPHADHIADIACLNGIGAKDSPFYADLHTCPHDKPEGSAKPEALNWNRIKNPESCEENIKIYRSLYMERGLPLQTILFETNRAVPNVPNLEYGLYYVRPPIVERIFPDNDQEYGNGISHVVYFRHGCQSILLTGDINPNALKHILDEGEGMEKRYTVFDRKFMEERPTWHKETGGQYSLDWLLRERGLSILLAPHHGLESGFSEDLYKAIKGGKPGLVAISEKRHKSKTDGSVHTRYSNDGALGQTVCIEGEPHIRLSVSTRNGHHILLQFHGTSARPPDVYLEKDPELLLSRMK